ncbi:MAG: UbiD family decarboxylase [Gammaproteobacteria bacterium]|nr:UbiD family decarboxylase [Gammaproteobacteria bacterium]
MKKPTDELPPLDRRSLITAAAAMAAAAVTPPALSAETEKALQLAAANRNSSRRSKMKFPCDTMRDWIQLLDDYGLLMRLPRLDQDAYEVTALAYRLMDMFGWYGAPAVLCDEVKIDGKWVKGPLIVNHQGHWDTEAMLFGMEPGDLPAGHGSHMYQRVIDHFIKIVDEAGGKVPAIPPVVIPREKAPVKSVILTGDAIDLTKFAFIQSNPADAGRYVNTGSVFTSDPELGMNYGTYRCQIRGKNILGVNPEPGQRAWKMFTEQRKRGEKFAKVSIVVGQDPMVWMISGSALTKGNRDDELALAGGLRGKPVEVVKSETNDHMIPAHAEMVIEGEVPLQEGDLPEGPFGEMYGYLGLKKDENFWMRVTCITHRPQPWIINQFTGVTRGFCTAPTEAFALYRFRKMLPGIVGMHSPVEATGWGIVSIDKTKPGQGLEIGRRVAQIIGLYKVVVVVDKDIDIFDRTEVMHIIGSRWQPYPAAEIIQSANGMPLDPSSPNRPKSSKIIIDATKQWPEEGGPNVYPELNRDLLNKLAPDSFKLVDAQWDKYVRAWKKDGCPPRYP